MSSAICQNFVQNAWKKELCSNCFKSKDEHAERPKPKPIALISNSTIEGIIKTPNKLKPKRSVCFTPELSEVIGFGGEDWESDDPDDQDDDDSSEDDLVIESEEEESGAELKRITKENTDFNTVNLKLENGVKKTAQLLLGKPIVDSNGKKQTLMVSVTPFGEDAPPNPKRFIKTISHIPISKTSNKESVPETKPNSVVLTSYTKNEDESRAKLEEKSLLDEITETLENSKNPIQIMTRKKTVKDIVLTVPADDNKENVKIEDDNSKSKFNSTDRKVALSRTPALKRDQEKPVIYQTSTAKIELSKLTPMGSLNRTKKDEKIEEKIEVQPPKSSREQAGEPDGRADPDTVTEPPALPLTPPPPLDVQNSFLHSPIYEKPKVPSKPATVLIRKPVVPTQHSEVKNQVLTTFGGEPKIEELKPALCKQDSNGNKRRAPKPPEEQIYTRNSLNLRSDSPVVRELEKRDRASSCSPKMRDSMELVTSIPEPAPRKMLSVSTDSLASEEKKSKEKKGRFSLKRFLRMGNNKDGTKLEILKFEEVGPPLPKPRLVIVHPSDFNGARVEVAKGGEQEYQTLPVERYSDTNGYDYEKYISKAQKPPPPPRNDDVNGHKPNLPHPPKSVEILKKQKQYTNNSNRKEKETVYANIGEVRSAIVPNKPQRTASMREHDAQQKQDSKMSNNYEPINIVDNGENVYDYINSGRSSSPDSDSSRNKNSPTTKTARLNKRSESSIDVSGDYFKYSANIPRSLSLTYCGSETESEIYSPYSFYGSESEVTEDDHEWIQNGRTHKLRSRKGRSIVHKNLEDNYGAVVVANHEALAQVLENIQQTNHVQPALRGLKSLSQLRWTDFTLTPGSTPLTVGCRRFQQALWNTHHVTLVINTGVVSSSTLALGTYNLSPIIEFSDLVPAQFSNNDNGDNKYIQATVSVLPWLQVNTIESYSESVIKKGSQSHEDGWKDASFVMLQLVNALKVLQAQGIEELSLSLNSFVLCKDMDKDGYHRLCILQGLGEDVHLKPDSSEHGTLCMCASKALSLLQPTARITPLIQSLLNNERAVTLTQVKSILEFCLWGPSDVALGSTIRERELALQRWLDLQRATVLHGLVCTRVQLTVYEECHLFFLVRSNARMMCDASLLLESSNFQRKS